MKTFHVCFLQSYNSFPLDSKKRTEFLSVISVKGAKKKEEKKKGMVLPYILVSKK